MSGPRPGPQAKGLERGQISTNQFIWMLLCIIASFARTFVPAPLIDIAGSDAWISMILACVLDIGLAGVYAYMGLRFPGETFTGYASSAMGPWLGKPVGLMFPLFFFFVDTMLLRSISDVITTLFLPGTPSVVIAGAVLVVAAYGARAGLETVARSAELLAPLFIGAILVGLLLASPHMQTDYIAPPLSEGIRGALLGVPISLSFLAICIIMGTFQAYHNEPHRSWFSKATAVTLGSTVVAGPAMAAIALVGTAAAAGQYPDLIIAKIVTVAGEIIERVEILWVVVTLGAAVLGLTILLWNSATGLAETFGLKEYRPLVAPLSFLMLPLSLVVFSDQVQEDAFVRYIFPLYALTVEAGLEILIWLVALVRGKRGRGQSSPRVDLPEQGR